jgi:formylglycine-generating enzyme required for sulfatase activity
MHGNIAEWCKDWHAAYDTKEVVDPQGPATGSARVCRGGFWADVGASCRSAARAKKPPQERTNTTGFRVVWRPKASKSP